MTSKNPDALEGIEIQRFLAKLKERWKLYVLGGVMALVLTFAYHRYAVPRYLVISTLLQNSQDAPSVLKEKSEFEWLNIMNEVEILRSTQVMRRAIEHAQLYFEISERGLINSKPVVEAGPISLEIDILRPNVTFDYTMDFRMIDEGNLYLEASDLPEVAAGRSYPLPLDLSTEAIKITVNEGPGSVNEASYSLRVRDPLTRAIEVKELMNVDLTSKESSVIKIELESSAPTWAIHFIERLIKDYQSLKIEHKNESILNSLAFINEQLSLIKTKLNQIEYELVRFRERNETIDINAEGSAVLTTLLDLENELAAKRLQMNYYTQFLEQMNSADSNQVFVNPSAVGITDRVFNEAVTSLNSMILDLNQLRTSSTEINPRYQALERSIGHQIELLKSSIDDYRATTVLSISQLEGRINEQEREIRRLPSTQKNLISLQREFDMNETMYLFLEERRAEAEILKASNISQIQVIDSPYVFSKVFPRELLNYLISLLVAGLTIYFGTTIYDLSAQKLDSAQDLATKTGLPVIGILKEGKSKALLPSTETPSTEATESFRRMTTHLRNATQGKKLLQVSSATDKEGRTYVAVNLAAMLARYRYKVILVDANLRNPRVSKFLRLDVSAVMAAYLDGSKDINGIISTTAIDNLDAIGGYQSEDGNELLNTPRLASLWATLKNAYDYVVVDTAPLLTYPDALDLLEFADYNVFVVSKEFTPASALGVLKELQREDTADSIGLVFNEQQQPIG